MEAARARVSVTSHLSQAGDERTPDTEEIDQLISVFEKWNGNDIEPAFFALLKKSCQLDALPESKKQEVRSCLVQFLEKIMPSEKEKMPLLIPSVADDTDQLLGHYLTKLLLIGVKSLLQLQIGPSTDKLKQIEEIYAYLEKNVNAINDQLLDQVVEFFYESQRDMAQTICKILSNSKSSSTCLEADYLSKNFTSSRRKDPTFFAYLCRTASTAERPKTAYFAGKECLKAVHQNIPTITALKFLLKAAEQGYAPAIETIKKKAHASMCPETLFYFASIFFDGSIPALQDKNFALKLLEKGKQLQEVIKVVSAIWREENERFNIPTCNSVTERVQLAKNWIDQGRYSTDDISLHKTFKGIVMLESLLLFDVFHPSLKEAKDFLPNFLSISGNRIWLIGQYAIEASKDLYNNNGQNKYTNLFEKHISIVLQDILKLFEQGNATAGKRLMHQLVDQEINFEWQNSSIENKNFCSYFFDLLLDKNLPDDILQEVKLRRDRSINECLSSPENLAEQTSEDESLQLKQRLNELLLSSEEKDVEDQFKLGLILHVEDEDLPTAKKLIMKAERHGHEQARHFRKTYFPKKAPEKEPEDENCSIQ